MLRKMRKEYREYRRFLKKLRKLGDTFKPFETKINARKTSKPSREMERIIKRINLIINKNKDIDPRLILLRFRYEPTIDILKFTLKNCLKENGNVVEPVFSKSIRIFNDFFDEAYDIVREIEGEDSEQKRAYTESISNSLDTEIQILEYSKNRTLPEKYDK